MQEAATMDGIAELVAERRVPLGTAPRGFSGHIDALTAADTLSGVPAAEIERRLIELGFVEGARVEILHEGLIGRDPIAVRINDATVALRRREAMAILVS
jgi:ferrous iron transport protein A